MSDQGGHGGATDSETRVPVIFLKTGETSFKEKRKGIFILHSFIVMHLKNSL